MNPHQLASNSHRRSEVYPFFQLIMLSHCSPKAQVSEASLTQGTKSRQVPDPLTCSPAFNSEPHMCWLGTFADPDTTQPSSPCWIWICFGSCVESVPRTQVTAISRESWSSGRAERAENTQSTGQEDEGITAAGQPGSPGYTLHSRVAI